MQQGIFAIVGIILGVLLSNLNAVLERRRDTTVEARRAVRLFDGDLLRVERAIGGAELLGRFRHNIAEVNPLPNLPTTGWEEGRGVIASLRMPDADWLAIQQAALAVNALADLGRMWAEGSTVEGLFEEVLGAARADISAGRVALARLHPG